MYMEHDHPKPEPFKNNILVINYMYLRGKKKEELKEYTICFFPTNNQTSCHRVFIHTKT